jgi:selenide, water dikinase
MKFKTDIAIAKTIVLVGSGHAHLEVIKGLSLGETAAHNYILISPNHLTYYSGLIPRFLSGEVDVAQLTIHSAELAEAKGIRFLKDSLQSVDRVEKTVTLTSGVTLKFDLLSINIGGTVNLIESESASTTVYLRPFEELTLKWPILKKVLGHQTGSSLIVIGGGPASVEVATAIKIHLNEAQAHTREVHLITRGERLCENYSLGISDSIQRSLLNLGIQIHFREDINFIPARQIALSDGNQIKYDLVFVAISNSTSKVINGKIDSRLQLSTDVFAAGDAVEMQTHSEIPRSGVTAVKQGRHIGQSIRLVLNGQTPKEFVAKAKQLNILISSADTARLVWGKFSIDGKWPLRLKNWIDQRYIKSFKT